MNASVQAPVMTFAATATSQADSGNFTDAASDKGEDGDVDIEFATDGEQQQYHTIPYHRPHSRSYPHPPLTALNLSHRMHI